MAGMDHKESRKDRSAYLKDQQLSTKVEEIGGDYYVRMGKMEFIDLEPLLTGERNYLLVMGSQFLGSGSEELGKALTESFYYALTSEENLPAQIILINDAVKLAAEDSPVLPSLIDLEKRGVHILVCGASLDYFCLREKLCAGEIGNMYTIAEHLSLYPRVVTLP